MKIKCFYILLLFYILPFKLFTQNHIGNPKHSSIFINDETSSRLNNMVDFEFDEFGRAWILLTNGLILYDGNKFQSFPFSILGFPIYHFEQILKNPSGGFYLVGYRFSLSEFSNKSFFKIITFDPLLKTWEFLENEKNKLPGEIKINPKNFYSFKPNKIGFISANGCFYVKNDKKWSNIFTVPNLTINTIYPAKNGEWHAISLSNYFRLSVNGEIKKSIKIKGSKILDFIEFNKNTDEVLLVLQDKIVFIDEKGKQLDEMVFENKNSYPLDNVLNAFFDSKNRVWLKYIDKVVLLNEKGFVEQEFQKFKNLNSPWISKFAMSEDNLKNIWIHSGKGMFINSKNESNFQFLLENKGFSFRGLAQINDSVIYFNSYKGNGFLNINSKKIITLDSKNTNFLGAYLYEKKNKIYVGSSNQNGIETVDFNKNKTLLNVRSSFGDSINLTFIKKGLKDNYFLAGDFGLQLWDIKNTKFKEYILLPFNHYSVNSILDAGSFYLVGTNMGLLKYSVLNKKWEKILPIHNIRVTEIIYTNKKYVISTAGKGFFVLDKNFKIIKNIQNNLIGTNKVIFSMVLGLDHNIWAGSEKGLYRINPEKGTYDIYSQIDGLKALEFNWISTLTLENGEIIMGTINGLIRFNPLKIKKSYENLENGKLFLSEIKIYNNINNQSRNGLIEYLENGRIVLKPSEYGISLKPGFSNLYLGKPFIFNINAPYFKNRQNIDSYQSITLNPTPGKSNILINFFLNTENNLKNQLNIPVYKQQYIQENKGFWIFSFILFISMTGLIFLQNYKFIKGKNKMLELDLKSRVLELEENEKLLIEKNDTLRFLNEERRRIFDIIGHEINTPLAGMSQLSQTFNYLLNKGDFEKALKIADSLEHSSNEISHLFENLMTWSNIENKIQISQNISFNIIDKFDSIVHLFDFQILRKSIDFSCAIEDNFSGEITSDPNITSFIFRNILGNAIKYCPENGQIICQISSLKDEIKIEIFNSSTNIVPNSFFKDLGVSPVISNPGTFNEKGLGIGLFMVIQLIQKIKGNIDFRIHETGGFTVELRLKKVID